MYCSILHINQGAVVGASVCSQLSFVQTIHSLNFKDSSRTNGQCVVIFVGFFKWVTVGIIKLLGITAVLGIVSCLIYYIEVLLMAAAIFRCPR